MIHVNNRPYHVRHSTLILSWSSSLICDWIELSLLFCVLVVLEFRVCIRAIHLLSYTLVLQTNQLIFIHSTLFPSGPSPRPSSSVIDVLCQDHHLFILLICVCIWPSTLVSGPFILRRAISVLPPCVFIQTIISVFAFSNMCCYPQHHWFVLSLPPCLYPNHHLLDISVLFESRPFSIFPLYYVFVSEPSSPIPSLEMPVPSQGHYGFHSFPVVDWFWLFI